MEELKLNLARREQLTQRIHQLTKYGFQSSKKFWAQQNRSELVHRKKLQLPTKKYVTLGGQNGIQVRRGKGDDGVRLQGQQLCCVFLFVLLSMVEGKKMTL